MEKGPLRPAARVTTTFDNGRTHVVTVGLWSGSHSIDVDETFDVGPDDKYQFKKYADDKDELAWEWWSWYGDREGAGGDAPEQLGVPPGERCLPAQGDHLLRPGLDRFGQGPSWPSRQSRGRSGRVYPCQRQTAAAGEVPCRAHAVAAGFRPVVPDESDQGRRRRCGGRLYALGPKLRNPNVLPTPKGITLRTGANDIRAISRQGGQQLELERPIGLGRRTWAIRVSTRKEMLDPAATSPTALDAERVQRCMGLDITRHWITDWAMNNDYPRLFIKPEEKAAYYVRLKDKGTDSPGSTLDFFATRTSPTSTATTTPSPSRPT